MPFVNGDVPLGAPSGGRGAGRVPTGRLHFRKDDSFWTILEEAA
jgi:hypothetical protein